MKKMTWLKNSDGNPDAVLTMAFIGFVVVLLKVFLSGVTIMGTDVSLGVIDATTIGAVLVPTLGAYISRRYTDKKFASDGTPETGDGKGQ